jgi:ATP-dependent DNA helicase RecQ
MDSIEKALRKYWGYEGFLPLQREAMGCVCGGRDSIVVLPTGGGKSLCFQAPAVTMPGLAIVISPLISLMKDQVDALAECGVQAARFDSTQSSREQSAILVQIRERTLKLLYLSPERIVSGNFTELLRKTRLSLIAVDEAHCVSTWGHDFRPEYRGLGFLKEAFPGVAIHAYTATATERVRRDIVQQLRLENPEVLVGSFDRPNLAYKAERRTDKLKQVCAVIDRHKGDAGIIYCLRRVDVDDLCSKLSDRGYSAAPYHAGMTDEDRKKNQDLFMGEKVDIIVATIAFGMGIDKPNVRYVIHVSMSKSLEHYQQESGRAGRDGLEAECCMFYSGSDYVTWKTILKDMEPEAKKIALGKLNSMYEYCTGVVCRHRTILSYFGQELEKSNCAACDVCLGDLDCMEDSLVISQKILSCVIRLGERFGADYTALVLIGSSDQRILENGHDELSTYRILSDYKKRETRDWIEQLVAQGCILKTEEYNLLKATEKGWRVMKGKETPRLLTPVKKRAKTPKAMKASGEGVNNGLFEALRKLRREIADKKRIPAYIVFSDVTLLDMARRRPSTPNDFLMVSGVGEKKKEQYSDVFLSAIKEYCLANSVGMNEV